MANNRCLALLGDPGSGKSEEVTQQAATVSADRPDDVVQHFQLRDFQTDLKLCQDIFDKNPKFQAWLQGTERLYLYLDSLDEGLLNVTSLATLLLRELKKYPPDRLYLRIACRTAEWPEILETGLKDHWGKDEFNAYELLPLREKDIAEAARSDGIDPKSFLEELAQKSVGPLAIKPVTLNFLLTLFQKHGALPRTQVQLYSEGCRYLCEETSTSRIAAGRRGQLSTGQRLAVAQRIAAISVFGNKSAVWMGFISESIPDGDVPVEAMASGIEATANDRFQMGENEIRETLSTGLFSSRGPNRIGWAHQTYAEFLAAKYLVEHNLSFDQKMSLLTSTSDTEGKLIPQLHETAAWISSMDKAVFKSIMRTDPVVLLRSDVGSADEKDRSALVESLLESADNEEWIDHDWSLQQFYSKLKHSDLPEQLVPYLTDNGKSLYARRISIDIAEACEAQALQNELVRLALHPTEEITLRVNAAYAVVRISDSETKAKLRPLAFGEAGDDPDDELKGLGLKALWPDHLSSEDLLGLLTYPKRPSLIGSYTSFIGQLEANFEGEDLVRALNWLLTEQIHWDSLSPFRSFRNKILRSGWQNSDNPAVAESLADLIVNNVRNLRGDEDDDLIIEDEKRYKLLELVIPRLSQGEKASSWYGLVYGQNRLIVPADVPWLIGLISAETRVHTQKFLADVIQRVLDPRNTDHVALIIEASSSIPALAQAFAWFLNPVYLNSEQANLQRKSYAEAQEMNRGITKPPPLDPPPSERVRRLLDRFESGDTAAWWQLNLELTVEEDSRFYGDESQSNLTKLAGWQLATSEDKRRIVESAKQYLLDGNPEPKKWLGTNILYRPAYAGYRAMRLLSDLEPNFLLNLPSGCWQKWACAVVGFPFQNEVSDAEDQAKLVRLAYERSPSEVITAVSTLIRHENKTDGFLSVLPRLKYCWDERLSNVLTTNVKRGKLKPSGMGQLLSELLAHDVLEAKRYAEALVRKKLSSPSSEARLLTVARALVSNADDAGWKIIWKRMLADRNFGRQLIESVVGSIYIRRTSIAERLSEEQLADLFIWLAQEYPHSTDPRHEGVFSMGPDDYVRTFRDSILTHIKQRGTDESVTALEKIVRELPKLSWLKWILVEAREANRRHSWVPVQPPELLRIAHDSGARLVQSGEQLLAVVVESLGRLQEKLHGETPAAADLWNEVQPGIYRPKDENHLSDYVKRHLEEDLKTRGIIANREVQIRRGAGSFRGQNTDVHVDAVTRNPQAEIYDKITVILETKGSWNPDLDDAMESQLKERYLKDNQCRFGLYLVGWFHCPQWDSNDPRQQRSPKLTRKDAQMKFDHQAELLSRGGVTLRALVIDTGLSR